MIRQIQPARLRVIYLGAFLVLVGAVIAFSLVGISRSIIAQQRRLATESVRDFTRLGWVIPRHDLISGSGMSMFVGDVELSGRLIVDGVEIDPKRCAVKAKK